MTDIPDDPQYWRTDKDRDTRFREGRPVADDEKTDIAWTKCLPDIDMAQLGEES